MTTTQTSSFSSEYAVRKQRRLCWANSQPIIDPNSKYLCCGEAEASCEGCMQPYRPVTVAASCSRNTWHVQQLNISLTTPTDTAHPALRCICSVPKKFTSGDGPRDKSLWDLAVEGYAVQVDLNGQGAVAAQQAWKWARLLLAHTPSTECWT